MKYFKAVFARGAQVMDFSGQAETLPVTARPVTADEFTYAVLVSWSSDREWLPFDPVKDGAIRALERELGWSSESRRRSLNRILGRLRELEADDCVGDIGDLIV